MANLDAGLAQRLQKSRVVVDTHATGPLDKLGEQISKTWFESLKMGLEVAVSSGDNPSQRVSAKRLGEILYVLDANRGGHIEGDRLQPGKDSVVFVDIPMPPDTFQLLRQTALKSRKFDEETSNLMKLADQKLSPLLAAEGLTFIGGQPRSVPNSSDWIVRVAVHSPSLHAMIDS